MKFVWLELPDGAKIPVNPDQVAYLRRNPGGQTMVVFGAVNGGLHEQVVAGSGEDVVKVLEGVAGIPTTEAAASPASPGRDKRRTPKAARPQRT